MRYNIVWTGRFLTAVAMAGMTIASADAQTTPPTPVNQGGPMTIEQSASRFAIAPEYKVSDFDGFTAQMIGAHGGALVAKSFLVGAGLYTMVNGEDRRGLTYGGAVIGWEPFTSGRLGVNVRSLIGMGRGTTTESVTLTTRDRRGTTLGTREATRWVTSDLFVAEPQVDLLFGLTKHIKLDIGGGYRFAHADRIDNDRFSGAGGTIALRFGSSE